MEISYRNYVFRMCKELCLGWDFSYLLVRNSPTFNNEVVWFGCGPQWRKILYRENVGFWGRCCPYVFCFGHHSSKLSDSNFLVNYTSRKTNLP